jgi:hypothetical protein
MFWPQPFSCHVDGTQINQRVCVRACVRGRARHARPSFTWRCPSVRLFTENKTHTKITILSTEYSDVRINNKVGTVWRYWRLKDQVWDRYTVPLVIHYRRWHSFCRHTHQYNLFGAEQQKHSYTAMSRFSKCWPSVFPLNKEITFTVPLLPSKQSNSGHIQLSSIKVIPQSQCLHHWLFKLVLCWHVPTNFTTSQLP